MELQIDNTCHNCSTTINETFCSSCGQKKYKRIDKKYIWDEIQYTFLHFNKGFLYSVKNVLKNPGKTARDFIEGKRVNHYKPISLAFVLSSLSAFIAFAIINLGELMKAAYKDPRLNTGIMHDLMEFNAHYSPYIFIAIVPLVAIITKLVFRKWGHNYYEHVVMNAFGLSCYTIITILFMYPLLYFIKSNVNLVLQISNLTVYVMIPMLMVWFFKGFYNDRKLTTIIWKVFLIVLTILIVFVILIIAGMVIYFALNPEAIKAFKPK
jgi:hypothetical protein